VADKATLERFAESVIRQSGHVDYIVNNALPLMKGIDGCSPSPQELCCGGCRSCYGGR